MLPAVVAPGVDSGLVFDQYDHCGDNNPTSEHVLWTRRWIWPHWPFCPGALVNRVWYQWLLYRGHEVVGPAQWSYCFLAEWALRLRRRIRVAVCALGSSLCGDRCHILLQCLAPYSFFGSAYPVRL